MPRITRTLVLCALSALACTAARAATTTYKINVSSYPSNFQGSFTLTFDPTLVYLTDTTAGLTVNSLSFSAGASGFQYVPSVVGGTLTLGGLLNGVRYAVVGTDDYNIQIGSFLTNPMFQGITVSSLASNQNRTDSVGLVTVTQVATTPEPSSLALLGTGLLGVLGVARKRFS